MKRYQYGMDYKPGMAVEVLFGTDSGVEWLPGTVEEVDSSTGRVLIRRTDGKYAPATHPRSIRVPCDD